MAAQWFLAMAGNRLCISFAVHSRCREVVLGTCAGVARGMSTALLGPGVAAAADYDGQTYADAAAAIEESGGTPIIATRVGSQLSQDECILTNSQDHSYLMDTSDEV